MQIEQPENFMKACILFFSIFSGCVEINALGLSNCGILYSAVSYKWKMYNEACLGMPKAPKINIQQTLIIRVLDLLDFFNAIENSSEIQGSIQEALK